MELLSVLILTYAVSGHTHESEIILHSRQCEAAQAAITQALRGPRQGRPTVELQSGRRVPVLSVQCSHTCPADGQELALLEIER